MEKTKRRNLKKEANLIKEKLIIGKNGIDEKVIGAIDELLKKDELVKIKVLNNNLDDRKDLLNEIIESTDSEYVDQIGNKLVIYREKEEE
ncbi:YhbY family RNA-binding protein [Citroniella saccharovorans]|uniref:YhbY family RNA-binding protein n=1 Tax=Citroniella saccharovorans TaxID=2053367 RepID=A0AAW9N125_9FIRM|nr:YhbY family RNA-binding protein [Citroniella saccharovorans]MEB3429987.1 YhbY family RNA-binding protein [Citroniella saccharovorans]